MDTLHGVVRHYDWGSPHSIPELVGRPATGEPWAELWLGAHPSAPSEVGSGKATLDAVIAADPRAALGAAAERFDGLPFLLKVLAAAQPLSLQAHPNATQAEQGFAREEAAGVAVDAPERSFRDRSHKPELICALSEFRALCGFRDPTATIELLSTIDTEALEPVRDRLRVDAPGNGLGAALEYLLRLDPEAAADLTVPVVDACERASAGPWAAERAMAADLGHRYPGDAGVVTALLLNLVVLQPGEALFLGAGNLHAYLHGTAVEIMASSDNVLRGGLTPKHVDVDALLDIVVAEPIRPDVQRPVPIGGEARYDSPVPEFALSRFEIDGDDVEIGSGPAILLCTEGTLEIDARVVDRGEAVWVAGADGAVVGSGRATVFWAGVGDLGR